MDELFKNNPYKILELFEIQRIDELRKVRNGINYRGLMINKDYLERNELEFKNIITRLKEEIKK